MPVFEYEIADRAGAMTRGRAEAESQGARGSDGGQMLLNLSCLMDRGGAALGRVLDEIQRTEGVWARFTGPWPPYNFVSAG